MTEKLNETLQGEVIYFDRLHKYFLTTKDAFYLVSGTFKGSTAEMVYVSDNKKGFGFRIEFVVGDKNVLRFEKIEFGKIVPTNQIKVLGKDTILIGNCNYSFIQDNSIEEDTKNSINAAFCLFIDIVCPLLKVKISRI